MYSRLQGENARMASFVGAIAIADLVKTTLGPKGMDKILQSVCYDALLSCTHHAACLQLVFRLSQCKRNPVAGVHSKWGY
jgi:hypothetical protein